MIRERFPLMKTQHAQTAPSCSFWQSLAEGTCEAARA